MMRRTLALAVAALLACPVVAEAPSSSIRPERSPAKPAVSATTAAVRTVVEQLPAQAAPRQSVPVRGGTKLAVVRSPAPKKRPNTRRAQRAAAAVASASTAGVAARASTASEARPTRSGPSPAPEPTIVSSGRNATENDDTRTVAMAGVGARPAERPRGLGALFGRRAAQPAPRYPAKGSVCGDRSIRGVSVSPIGKGGGRGCGIAKPVRITEVSGVKLSTPATVDCSVAQSLKTWIENGAAPAVGRRGGGIAGIKVAAHYACRTRNNRPGARLSEHAKGRAIDISAITLRDGSSISVLRGWRNKTNGSILKKMHKAACGPFGTVLGPNSDRFHQDHFHFDTASYRSGPYCR